jgi:membrane protein
MTKRITDWARLLYRAGDHMVDNFGIEMAGYLTFMLLLSIFPYLVLMVSAAGVVGQGETGREIIALVMAHLPAEAATTLAPRVNEIVSGPPQGLLTFAILGAIWTSSSAIEGIRFMLNRAYRVPARHTYIAQRFRSILQVILFTLLILSVMLVLVLVPVAMAHFTALTGIEIPLELRSFINAYFVYIGVAALFVIVASLYYCLPNLKQHVSDVVPGALLVMLLWGAGAYGVAFYVNEISQLTVIYGSLSGFIATLIFFYVMLLIFIYGAEFNHALALARGRRIEAIKE